MGQETPEVPCKHNQSGTQLCSASQQPCHINGETEAQGREETWEGLCKNNPLLCRAVHPFAAFYFNIITVFLKGKVSTGPVAAQTQDAAQCWRKEKDFRPGRQEQRRYRGWLIRACACCEPRSPHLQQGTHHPPKHRSLTLNTLPLSLYSCSSNWSNEKNL